MIRLFTLCFKNPLGYALNRVANPATGGLATLLFEEDLLLQFHIRDDRFYLVIQLFIDRIKFTRAV